MKRGEKEEKKWEGNHRPLNLILHWIQTVLQSDLKCCLVSFPLFSPPPPPGSHPVRDGAANEVKRQT